MFPTDDSTAGPDADNGPPDPPDALVQLAYDELRRLADGYIARERVGHTLQPTALVHEAYLRLADSTAIDQSDRERFLASAALAMRRVLVDHARRRESTKRSGGYWERVTLSDVSGPDESSGVDLVALDEALDKLGAKSARVARVVELRFFGGLTIEEIARIVGVSSRSIDKDWFLARSWLARELGGGDAA